MSKTVQPIKIRMMPAEDVPVGKTFALDGVRYIKLSDDDRTISNMNKIGILATTVLPLCQFASNNSYIANKKSVEERAVEAFIAAAKEMDNDNILTCGMPNTDCVRVYGSKLKPYIKGFWYVDNGAEDVLNEGEYFYVDEFGDICKANEYDEKVDGINRCIGVRAFYAIDPDVLVTVKDCDLEGTYRRMAITNQEAAARIRWNNERRKKAE